MCGIRVTFDPISAAAWDQEGQSHHVWLFAYKSAQVNSDRVKVAPTRRGLIRQRSRDSRKPSVFSRIPALIPERRNLPSACNCGSCEQQCEKCFLSSSWLISFPLNLQQGPRPHTFPTVLKSTFMIKTLLPVASASDWSVVCGVSCRRSSHVPPVKCPATVSHPPSY